MKLQSDHAIMRGAGRIIRLVMVVGFEATVLVWLLSLGRQPWLHIGWYEFETWMRVAPTEDVIASFVWVAALGCVIWLTGSTLLYLMARASHNPMLIRSIEWMTLPAIRRVTEKALGAVLVASTMTAAPVRADPPPPVVVVVDSDGTFVPPGLVEQIANTPQGPSGPPESFVPPLPLFPYVTRVPVDEVLPAAVTVQPGDNLWVICRRHLTEALGRRPTNEQIAPYWRQVMATNQPGLISGNPDLIYAGEVIELPPTS